MMYFKLGCPPEFTFDGVRHEESDSQWRIRIDNERAPWAHLVFQGKLFGFGFKLTHHHPAARPRLQRSHGILDVVTGALQLSVFAPSVVRFLEPRGDW